MARRRRSTRRAALAGLVLLATACTGGGDDHGAGSGAAGNPPESRPPTSVTTSTVVRYQPTTTELGGAGALAAELSAVEAGIRRAGVTDEELAALGRRQQLAYRAVNQHPDWVAALQDLVDPVAATPLQFHLAARRAQVDHDATNATEPDPAAPATSAPPAPTLPAWTIVEPLPIAELRGYYAEAEAATGVPWQYLAAINFQETRMGRVVGTSTAGAVGPMQFLPSTWEACCTGDPTVARDAIMGAAQYLVLRGAPGDMPGALYGYNPNSAYVGAVTAYAQNMIADERAYGGYHGWEVFYATPVGTVRLPVGYSAAAPVDLASYVRDHPEDLLPRG